MSNSQMNVKSLMTFLKKSRFDNEEIYNKLNGVEDLLNTIKQMDLYCIEINASKEYINKFIDVNYMKIIVDCYINKNPDPTEIVMVHFRRYMLNIINLQPQQPAQQPAPQPPQQLPQPGQPNITMIISGKRKIDSVESSSSSSSSS
jgi:hypothetical protein